MNKKGVMAVFDIGLFLLLLAADQLSKGWAQSALMGQGDIVLIPGVFQLHYLENQGAAFSMLQNATPLFVLATCVMLVVVIYVLSRLPEGKRYFLWHLCMMLIAAGGIGNLIDRIRFSYVIDFFYFSLIDFPVFNVADICVTVAVAILAICILFVWKEEDMKFLERRSKTKTEQKDSGNEEKETTDKETMSS